MTVAREVIIDLLPLYAAGELSPQSRQLVDDHLASDASLRKLARALGEGAPAELSQLAAAPNGELEKRSFSRTRLLMGVRSTLIGAAIFATLSIFTVWSDGETVTWLMAAYPEIVRNLLVVAAVLWAMALFGQILWSLVSDAWGSVFKKK
jgi:hypothetical protein